MIDTIIKNLGPEIISNFGLSSKQTAKAVETTQSSLLGSFSKEMTQGNSEGLLALVNQGASANQSNLFPTLINNLAGDYEKKLGLSSDLAKNLARFVLPLVLDKIMANTGGQAKQSDLTKIVGKTAGELVKSKTGGVFGGLGKLFK